MREKWTNFSDRNEHKWPLFSNGKSKVNQIYRNGTELEAGLFAPKTLVKRYLPLIKIRKI
jgi:hypothetical protein